MHDSGERGIASDQDRSDMEPEAQGKVRTACRPVSRRDRE
jgi:hypothetical protein